MARSRAGAGVLRRRPLRRRRPAHAPGPGLRQGLRRRDLPALPGPAPGRAAAAATRASGPAGWGCPAGRRSPRTSSSPATPCSPAYRLAGPRRPRLHGGSVEVMRWAKPGDRVTAEVTPHHLALGTDLLAGYDPVFKVNPPLRPTEDQEAIREALARRHHRRVATDHAPHARHDKEHAFPTRPSACSAWRPPRRRRRPARAPTAAAAVGDLAGGCRRPGADRRAGRSRPADRGGRAGQPRARRPRRPVDRRPGRLAVRCPATTRGTAHAHRRSRDFLRGRVTAYEGARPLLPMRDHPLTPADPASSSSRTAAPSPAGPTAHRGRRSVRRSSRPA
jgi:hypothetical protein